MRVLYLSVSACVYGCLYVCIYDGSRIYKDRIRDSVSSDITIFHPIIFHHSFHTLPSCYSTSLGFLVKVSTALVRSIHLFMPVHLCIYPSAGLTGLTFHSDPIARSIHSPSLHYIHHTHSFPIPSLFFLFFLQVKKEKTPCPKMRPSTVLAAATLFFATAMAAPTPAAAPVDGAVASVGIVEERDVSAAQHVKRKFDLCMYFFAAPCPWDH